jgi:sugar O-acyltransferase (sialic acid O-acetyltransferase NeuD family)
MKFFVLGSGGFAREVVYVLDSQWNLLEDEIRYLSDDISEWGQHKPFGKVVGSIETCEVYKEYTGGGLFIPGIGSPFLRKELVERALKRGMKPISHIKHRQSFIGDAKIEEGSIICSMCSITTNVTIGKYVNVNLNCTIGHDTVIEDYVNLSPHCTISGKVHIEKYCDLGSGVDVLPGIRIGEGSIIGAGSVVTKDVPPHSLVVGVPGKVVKSLRKK